MKLKFLGAAKEVTGSKHLIVTNHGKKILLDCGMYQGKGKETFKLNTELGVNPAEIDHVILSHAHIDHSGLIPYMYRLGFRGSVICTHATRDLCTHMLADSGHIQEHDVKSLNRKLAKRGLPPVEPLYTQADAIDCMSLFFSVPYNKKLHIDPHLKVKFTHNGHMLGSAVISLDVDEGDRKIRIAYTGDIGRPINRILRPGDPFPQADILIAESTYGNRLHDGYDAADQELLDVIKHTCIDKGGKLIIPSFSVGRTQELVYSMNNLFNAGKLPKVPIFVDSPLAINVTDVFRLHPECFNKNILQVMNNDPDPFGFNSLHYIKSHEDSKKLNDLNTPCVIISASGMMEAGRIKHHAAHGIQDSRNTILFVGYCAPNTLGGKILAGDPKVSIHGNLYEVRAEIRRIESYSGHGDYKEMIDFISCQNKEELLQLYLVHGNFEAQQFYKERLEEAGFKGIKIPDPGDEHMF